MIEVIDIRNFKAIKEKQFRLKNLNLLLGVNGMGKSSFIQALLSLKQSPDLLNGRLDLSGRFLKLGNTKDVLYQYSKREDLEFKIQFSSGTNLDFKFKYKPEADYFLTENQPTQHRSIESKVKEETLFTDNFQYLNANRLEPTSVNPKNYSTVVNNRNVGIHGEYTAHFIEVYNDEDVVFENLLHPDSVTKDPITSKEVVNRTLINQINLWLGEISPNVNVRTTSISSDYILLEFVYKQANFGNTNRYKPENVGFGIFYVLSVVVTLLASRPGQLIIIENPESHIHPRGQAELGKLIAKVAKNDVQIIIETHSDHILNGIRVAVKEQEVSDDRVAAYYFERVNSPDEQFSKITDIRIDRNGELDQYPLNMLDEWNNQLFKLM